MLAQVSLNDDGQLFIAQDDVQDWFYRMGIDTSIGELFALPVVNRVLLKSELCLDGNALHRAAGACRLLCADLPDRGARLAAAFRFASGPAAVGHSRARAGGTARAPPSQAS